MLHPSPTSRPSRPPSFFRSITALLTGTAVFASGACSSDEGPAGATPVTPTGPSPSRTSTALGAEKPLRGMQLHGGSAVAAEAAARLRESRPDIASVLDQLADVPTAVWLVGDAAHVRAQVEATTKAAEAAGELPVFVLYNIPNRDCGGHSAGGAAGFDEYNAWVDAVAAGAGDREALFIVEPDAILHACDPRREAAVARAVEVLKRNPDAHVYLDAGHPGWASPATTAVALDSAGVASADGFALNVANYHATDDVVAYGREISSLVDGKHFVVDTSRNGNGSNGEWCNPEDRAVGPLPTTTVDDPLVDALLWVKVPGESDGLCNGGPAAGGFWVDEAVNLALRAGWASQTADVAGRGHGPASLSLVLSAS